MLDVFVATSAAAGSFASTSRNSARFASGVFDDRFDHDVCGADLVGCEIHRQASRGGRGVARRLESFAKQLLRSRESGIHILLRAVLQRDGEAAQRAPRGDVATHRSRADDMNPAKAPLFRREIAKAFAQLEHAHEIARRRRDEEGADRHGLCSERGCAAPTVSRPQRDDRVRRRVMLTCDALTEPLRYGAREDRADRRGAEQAEVQRRASRCRPARDQVRGSGGELRPRHNRVHEADAERFLRRQRPARQHQVERERSAEQLNRAHRAAEARVDTELDLGQPERALVTLGHHAIVARERELQSAAERKAVDGGDRRNAERRNPREQRLTACRERGALGRILEVRELLYVRAENESAALARLDHEAANVGVERPLELLLELVQCFLRERVDAAVGFVERQPADAVIDAPAPMSRVLHEGSGLPPPPCARSRSRRSTVGGRRS